MLSVKKLIGAAHCDEYISVENANTVDEVFAEGMAQDLLHNKEIRGLDVVTFWTGVRNNQYCTVIQAEKRKNTELED